MNTYCFPILTTGTSVDGLKTAVEKLYRTGADAFTAEEPLPFLIVYSEKNNTVCIKMKSRAKKVLERIEGIHSRLKPTNLLGEVYLVSTEECGTLDKNCLVKRGGRVWETLDHNGPYFAHIYEPYVPHRTPILYNGNEYVLSPEEEKVANFYAARIITDKTATVAHTTNPLFNKNFWNDFKTYLTPAHAKVFKDFNKFDFTPFVNHLIADKASKGSAEEKERRKIASAERELNYAYSYINGIKEKLGGVAVEPAAIFLGRGANPKLGMIKRDIYPEDVTINVGEGVVVQPPPGHEWKEVIHDHNVTWLASWKDTFDEIKYIRAGSQGQFKSNSDLIKYETARKLNKYILPVRKRYTEDYTSGSPKNKQLGTVMYLIDNYGLRVGGEKDDATEADTVGASTLRVEHVRTVAPDKIIFDFLGKDSIRFYKELKTNATIYKNFREFMSKKKPSDQLFDLVSANDINTYLKTFDNDFTAKVFRTRLASSTMDSSLKGLAVQVGENEGELKKQFNKANAVVAELLNHQRSVTAKAKETVEKYKGELTELATERQKIEESGKSTAAIDKRIQKKSDQIELKQDTLHIALTTSLTNYIDPRIVVGWTKRYELPITRVYPAKLQKNFAWAIKDTPPEWDYVSTPLEPGFAKLNPSGTKPVPTVATPAVKTVAKPVPTPAVKTVAKPVPTPAVKTVAKPVATPAVKTVAKPVATVATPAVKTVAAVATPEPTMNARIIEYSDKSIIVIGDTRKYKDVFMSMNGRYNPNLMVNGVKTPGWVFSNKHRAKVDEIINGGVQELLGMFTLTQQQGNIIKCFARNERVIEFLKTDLYANDKVYTTEYLQKFLYCLDEASVAKSGVDWKQYNREVLIESILKLLSPSSVSTFVFLIQLLYKTPKNQRDEYLNMLVSHLSDTTEINMCLCNNFADLTIVPGKGVKLRVDGSCLTTF